MTNRNAVVFLADSALFPSAVFQAERLARRNPRADTDICIISDSKLDLAKAAGFCSSTRLIHVDPAIIGVPFKPAYRTRTVYYRAYLPAILASDYARILQLDTDIAVEDDRLFALFDLDLADHPVAAIRDPMVTFWRVPRNLSELDTTRLAATRKYLNNGVTLIDPARFAALDLGRRLINILHHTRQTLLYSEQTALNYALGGEWLELSPAFNMLVPVWKSFPRGAFPPSIVHFAGPANPWDPNSFIEDHSIAAEMRHFFADSPWPDFPAKSRRIDQATGRPVGPFSLPPIDDRPEFDMPGFIDYMTTTRFADVDAGLTRPDPGHLPARISALD